MNWADLITMGMVAAWAGACTFLWKQNRAVMGLLRQMADHNHALMVQNVRVVSVCRALALRINPRGHVDLDPAEVEEDGEVQIFKEEDGVRVLVK